MMWRYYKALFVTLWVTRGGMTRICAISDTHGFHSQLQITPSNILICAGDFTMRGAVYEITAFAEWFEQQSATHKVCIAGNHELGFETKPVESRNILETHGVIYLQDQSVELEGLKFYGSPWQPEFCNWAFNLPRGHVIRKKWDAIPDDTNVLITHGPPRGYGDITARGERVGCADLAERVHELRDRDNPQLKLHISGHCHMGYGSVNVGGIDFVNASSCDERYRPINPPILVNV